MNAPLRAACSISLQGLMNIGFGCVCNTYPNALGLLVQPAAGIGLVGIKQQCAQRGRQIVDGWISDIDMCCEWSKKKPPCSGFFRTVNL